MRVLLIAALVVVSVDSHAIVKRLTNLKCADPQGRTVVEISYDSSISGLAPQEVKFDNAAPSRLQMQFTEGTIYSGLTAGNKPFRFEAKPGDEYQSVLTVDGQNRRVDCKVKTQFRLYNPWSHPNPRVNDSQRGSVNKPDFDAAPQSTGPGAVQH